MPHLELSLELDPHLDPLQAEAACFGSGALSVTFSDEIDAPAGAGAVLEPAAGEVRLWPRTRLTALFAADSADPRLIVTVAQALGIAPACLHARAVADRVWEREWLRDFHALPFGRRLWVCPQHDRATPPGAVVVRLEPGLAFGSGTHPSTALCLEWLDGLELAGREIIDYGCGSGVLAIAALKLGARRAYAFDIDPQALLATRENAQRNGVHERLQLCEHESELPRSRDLLVANLLSDILLSLAPALASLVAPGGAALLSGILLSQQQEVAAHYSAWFDMHCHALRDDWVALQGQRH
jgi:ribosomal protein L11 methyltransferase